MSDTLNNAGFLKALKEGKTIQFRTKGSKNEEWSNVKTVVYRGNIWEYRIELEPWNLVIPLDGSTPFVECLESDLKFYRKNTQDYKIMMIKRA